MQKRGVFGLKAGVAYDTQAALKRLQTIGAVEHFVKDGDNRETFRLTTRGRALLAFSTVDMETQLKRYAEYQHEENTHHKGDDASSLPDSYMTDEERVKEAVKSLLMFAEQIAQVKTTVPTRSIHHDKKRSHIAGQCEQQLSRHRPC